MTYCLTVKGPLGATEGSFVGPREYWEMTSEGSLASASYASIAMPGGDWMIVSVGPVTAGRTSGRSL